jgi:hypothetical protein
MEPWEHEDGPRILQREAWPGYRTAFFIVFAVAFIYLAILLIQTLGGEGGVH